MKKILLLGMVIFLLGLLAACGGGEESSGGSADETLEAGSDIEDATELTFWTFAGTHAEFFNDAAERWNEENPDRAIKLISETYPFDQMHNNLLLALQSGEGAPDLVDIEIAKFPNFLQGDIQLESLNDQLDPIIDNFVTERLDMYSKEDQYYGAPTHLGATVVYYNMDIMDEAGVDIDSIDTWDDYVEAGKQVLESTGKPMSVIPTNWYGFWPYISQKGSGFFDDNGELTLANEDNIETLKFIDEMVNEHEIAVVPPGADFHTEEFYGFMNDGGAASMTVPMYYMKDFTEYMPDLNGKIQIRPMPVWSDSDIRSVAMGGTGTAVTSQSADVELAKEFLSFTKLSEEGNIQLWKQLGFDPPRWDVWDDPEVRADNEFYEYFHDDIFDILLDIRDDISGVNMTEYTPDVLEELGANVLHGVIREDNREPEDALKETAETLKGQMQ
ncbi:ABC transporter substrate-binding protein [Aquibacillus sediminis]|uniref:ABC transporter substrate-binding protein n=1 Tax=Aquibacillus sediminis TaxID=2574734 RepID=UPI0011095CF0|nr:extracellular solute-binding protein [Aquibacillus sediminis]